MSDILAVLWFDLPPKECSPNGRYHWAVKSAAVKAYRSRVAYECKRLLQCRHIQPITEKVQIDLTFYLYRGRDPMEKYVRECRYFPRDEDNARASFKAGQDGMVDAGLLRSDSKGYVRAGVTRLLTTLRDHEGRCGVQVELRRATE